jgi:uncharacterized protein (DUF885 family)
MKKTLTAIALVLAVGACASTETAPPPVVTELPPAPVKEEKVTMTESEKLNAFFEEAFMEAVMRSPIRQSYLGIKGEDYGRWDDVSDERAREDFELMKARVEFMNANFDYDKLDEATKLSYDLFNYRYEQEALAFPWRDYGYTFNQMFGQQSAIPAFLINQHRVSSKSDAEAYISRLAGVKKYLGQHMANAKRSAEKGIRPPRFVYDYVISDAENVISGYPFSETEGMTDSPLMNDIRGKLDSLKESGKISEEEHNALLDEAEAAMLTSVMPAYEGLIAYLKADKSQATDIDGAWKFPKGGEYYAMRLNQMTTTSMTANEIHELGLSEVARIHDEMRAIMKDVGYEGTLKDFFEYTRTDPRFFKPNTPEGKAEYLAEATAIIDAMREELPNMFYTFPRADLVVKAVEPFREKSAGKAFYQRPNIDGSRPGTYYANLYNTADMPLYQMEALAYHEGIPGHHMQIAIAQELTRVPKFRKFGGYTAYTEGWGLYSEYFPKEYGFYEDPYSDFGRLAMELWRAARLVVDTGLHEKKWTREQATQYLLDNTPNPEGDAIKAIDRYIVMPGQATAYKIGMIKILELREHARDELGDAFDIREFHDTILKNGAVPLAVLQDLVDEWIAEKKSV